MTLDVGAEFSFASQEDVYGMLATGSVPCFGTILCLRRNAPFWWPQLALSDPALVLALVPIPPSLDPDCSRRLLALLTESLPKLPRPVVVFCKEGRHRTGMVAALIAFANGSPLDDAIAVYVKRSEGKSRAREIAIIHTVAEIIFSMGSDNVS